MNKLQYEFCDENSQQGEDYYNYITKNRKYVKTIDTLCKKLFSKSFKDIILLRPDDLLKFVDDFDKKNQSVKNSIIDQFKEIETNKAKKTNYIVDVLYKSMPDKARRIIYDVAGTKTCPYCNRNYVDIFNDGGKYKSTLDLDHFYSKEDYPMLAVSLYNLIPVCPSCNRIKGTKKLQYYPYDVKRNFSSDMRFSYNILNPQLRNENDIDIRLVYENEATEYDAQKLYLSNLYMNHRDVAIEVIHKARYQGLGYMASLTTQLQSLFSTEDEIYRAIYGNYLNEEDWNKRPLSKFTYDIAKEVLDAYGIDLKRGNEE